MSSCEAVRERLAEGAVDAADEVVEIKRHLQSCASCTKFLSELRRVESALRDLPPYDAPDAVVAETLRAVRQAANERDRPARTSATQRNIAAGLAAAAVITAGLGLTFTFLEPSYESVVASRNLAAPRGDVDGAETAARPNRGYAESADTKATRRDLGDDITESFETAQLGLKKAKQDQFQSQQEGERRPGEAGSYSYTERSFSDEETHRELDVITLLEAQDFDRQEAARAAHEPLEKDSERARNVDAGARAVPTTTTRGATSPPIF